MTSSLVGSEMCIRDRPCTSRGQVCVSRRKSAKEAANCSSSAGFGCSPVSYTHLTLPTICSV
eukprot:11416045-Prorocentrum_lima.AAC.1